LVEIVPRRSIASPCVNICHIIPATGRCGGCARTIDEIARWTQMGDTERARIMDDLPRRGRAS
jgi:predicted Fe-S protein YdhL (DUF1289 family)